MSISAPLAVVRVLSSDDPELVDDHGRLLEARFGLPTVSRCIPDQPHGIHDDASERRAEPKIVELVRAFAAQGASAVVISCAADPAVAAARAAVDVPVIGAGSAAAGVALGLGARIGVLGIRDEAPAPIAALLGERLTASRRPEGVHTTTELRTPEGSRAARAAAARLVADGAEVLLLACTGMTSLGLRPVLERELGVPVVDPVLAAGLLASYTRPADAS
ncbi:hydantoin racemase [Mangrovactinospora gilvigrisea]|uniref:Hydantoin racemase n=1 Tax=Mangrovactinospora gilvigrisea TaxID=1428644 RepID=A0A1J7C8P3_9ACTN|nr:aspartate/glutamate racemase family protein [Mangrovactinospora gilvigrisea]OIV37900.1 hydantoin racemase [Mangrovactinospora gilvigrisea]